MKKGIVLAVVRYIKEFCKYKDSCPMDYEEIINWEDREDEFYMQVNPNKVNEKLKDFDLTLELKEDELTEIGQELLKIEEFYNVKESFRTIIPQIKMIEEYEKAKQEFMSKGTENALDKKIRKLENIETHKKEVDLKPNRTEQFHQIANIINKKVSRTADQKLEEPFGIYQ